jgi:hypothetical protein
VSLREAPEALRRLPIDVRPNPAETVASYIQRLANANHLRSGYLRAYLCGPPDYHGSPDLERLAAVSGRPVSVLRRALTNLPPAPPIWLQDVTDPAVRAVGRKVTSSGKVSFANREYAVGRDFAGEMVQVTCIHSVVQISQHGKLLRAWPRRHPPAKDASIQPDRSHDRGELALDQAARLAPLDDLATDPRVVRRRVDPNGAVSFAGRYYTAGRWLTGQVVQVRCVNGVVQLILDGELVRAWRQRHTPEREQRMLQRPNPQQRTANARPLTRRHGADSLGQQPAI